MNKKIEPIHPGEILLEEFLIPMEISQYRLAKDINVPPRRINEIVLGKRAITADTALRLSEYFGLSEKFWLNLQMKYNLEIEKDRLKDKLKKEVKRREKVSYILDKNLNSIKSYYLGNPEEIAKAAAAVAVQGKAK